MEKKKTKDYLLCASLASLTYAGLEYESGDTKLGLNLLKKSLTFGVVNLAVDYSTDLYADDKLKKVLFDPVAVSALFCIIDYFAYGDKKQKPVRNYMTSFTSTIIAFAINTSLA